MNKTYEDGYREGFKDGFAEGRKVAGYDLAPPYQRFPVPMPSPFRYPWDVTCGPTSVSVVAKPDPNIQSWG